MSVPRIELSDGKTIPQLGFGVFQVPRKDTVRVVSDALEVGYRHIDTASFYGNEAEVGVAVERSGLRRDEVFITTKLWNSDQGRTRPLDAIERSLELLGLGRVDLYLIHWPTPSRNLYVDTWRAFEEIQEAGKAASIGVSNFSADQLDRLGRETAVVPVINQIEVHPLLAQVALRGSDRSLRIVTESWGPLGHGAGHLLTAPPIVRAAAAHQVQPAQVVLRWHVQHGLVAIPKSVDRGRMAHNLDVFDFELTSEEMLAIDAMDAGVRFGPDPARL